MIYSIAALSMPQSGREAVPLYPHRLQHVSAQSIFQALLRFSGSVDETYLTFLPAFLWQPGGPDQGATCQLLAGYNQHRRPRSSSARLPLKEMAPASGGRCRSLPLPRSTWLTLIRCQDPPPPRAARISSWSDRTLLRMIDARLLLSMGGYSFLLIYFH